MKYTEEDAQHILLKWNELLAIADNFNEVPPYPLIDAMENGELGNVEKSLKHHPGHLKHHVIHMVKLFCHTQLKHNAKLLMSRMIMQTLESDDNIIVPAEVLGKMIYAAYEVVRDDFIAPEVLVELTRRVKLIPSDVAEAERVHGSRLTTVQKFMDKVVVSVVVCIKMLVGNMLVFTCL